MSKLTKEECVEGLKLIHDCCYEEHHYELEDWFDLLEQLIKENFDGLKAINDVIKIQKENLTSSYMIGLYNGLVTAKNILLHSNDELANCPKNIDMKPCKYEDLKDGMWVWDDVEKLICKIGLITKNAIHRRYVDGTISDDRFEENRFFPLWKENQYQESKA